MIKNIKVRKTFVWTLKLLLFVGVAYFFMQQISRLNLNEFQSIKIENYSYFILVIILLPINWGLELLKWRRILRVNNIVYSPTDLIHSLFSGVTTGLITPNRIGNFIGRMLFFKGKMRAKLILGTLYSNFAQFLVTMFFGSLSFLFLHEMLLNSFAIEVVNISIIISFLSLLFYFAVPFVPLPPNKFLKRKMNVLQQFQKQSKKLIFPILFISIARYLVFTVQFLLMLLAFGEVASIQLYNGIFMLYFVSTLTPNLIFGKLFIREAAGLVILGFFIDNEAVILFSSLLLWVVNLGIPSLIGLFFIMNKKSFSNG